MTEPIGELTRAFLVAYGYSPQRISRMNAETRLFHDLGLYGDDIEEMFEVMQSRFEVNLSTMPLAKYFPGEFQHRWLSVFSPLAPWFWKMRFAVQWRDDRYPPITLAMIERTLKEKRWMFD